MFRILAKRGSRALQTAVKSNYPTLQKTVLLRRVYYSVKTMAAEEPAVTNFRNYLRINTMQPEPNYDAANVFLADQAKSLELPWRIIPIHPDPKRDVFLITWEGTDPSLPSILLNSHIDVVPVFREHWDYDPFDATKTENGNIYARGSQDMKCVGIQYLEAIRRLKKEGKRFPRTIHVLFVPDEEIGGHLGMMKFVEMEEFKALNVEFALDEGLASPTEQYRVFYGERAPWWVLVHSTGPPGHGSSFIENCAAEKMRKIINSFMEHREKEKERLKNDPELTLGDVTTINLNMVEGGVQMNVVPAKLTVGFDIRITPKQTFEYWDGLIQKWCKEAGDGVTVEFLQKFDNQNTTATVDDAPFWKAFSSACNELSLPLVKEIFPAATDSRYVRRAGIPALGFSPMNHTPILLHDHNEFLNEKVFLKGIDIYCRIIPAVASVPKFH